VCDWHATQAVTIEERRSRTSAAEFSRNIVDFRSCHFVPHRQGGVSLSLVPRAPFCRPTKTNRKVDQSIVASTAAAAAAAINTTVINSSTNKMLRLFALMAVAAGTMYALYALARAPRAEKEEAMVDIADEEVRGPFLCAGDDAATTSFLPQPAAVAGEGERECLPTGASRPELDRLD